MPKSSRTAKDKKQKVAPVAGTTNNRKTKKKGRRPSASKDPTAGLQVTNPNAGAVDIGCAEHWAAVPPGRAEQTLRQFGCFTADLEAMANWFVKCRVDTVILEATGNYWIVLYDLLEDRGLKPIVVNPRYAKNMSGKKGDIPDCQWMQRLHTYGLFANSFRPKEQLRILRSYLRQREVLTCAASQQIQHMQHALTEMNVQLANVIRDISGETGLRIIDAILAGQHDSQELACLKDPRIRATRQELAKALQGHWKEEQLFALEQARLSYQHYQEQILQCDERIEKQMKVLESRLPGATEQQKTYEIKSTAKTPVLELRSELHRIIGVDLLKIPGVGPLTAQIVLSEIGTDMSHWPTEKHFASWLGLCPDHRISGGRILARSTRPVVNRARNALRIAVYSLERSKTGIGAKYRRLKSKLGAPKAIVAMAHHLARLIYRMIKFGQDYVEKGMDAYNTKYKEQRIHWLRKQARELGIQLMAA